MKNALTILMLLAATAAAHAQQKVKDFVQVDGMGHIELKGFGVVIGLNGNGDSPGGETEQMIRNFLQNHTNRNISKLNIKNVAMVVVSARLRPFQKPGTLINVLVSALGDSKSLRGGELLMTTLRGMAPPRVQAGKDHLRRRPGR